MPDFDDVGRANTDERTIECTVVDDASAMPMPGGLITSYGFLEIGGTAAYEENIDRSERGFTGGVVARYGHSRISWIPSLSVKYEFVAPTHSEARRAAGLDEKDRHRRFSADAYLNVNLGFVSATLDGLGVAGETSWFKSSGLDPQLLQRSDGWGSGWHCAGTLRWTRPIGIARNVSVSQIYLRYGSGRLGTGATNEDGFRAGVDVTVGEGGWGWVQTGHIGNRSVRSGRNQNGAGLRRL